MMSTNRVSDATTRFSSRVSYYIKYRPSYPSEIIDFLKGSLGLLPSSVIADVGSGTGFLSELFLQNGHLVFGVEPNREMRAAAENRFQGAANFRSINGSAEATTLASHSVDFVVAGQAFHWFDAAHARAEFARIVKPRGWIVLIWNERRTTNTPFLRAFEVFLRTYGLDYLQVNHKNVDDQILHQFFGGQGCQVELFSNAQTLDYESLKGRVLSSSYMPLEGHPKYEPMIAALQEVFDSHQTGGVVRLEYETKVYYGQLTAEAVTAPNRRSD